MRSTFLAFTGNARATASVEMALSLPILMALLFGAFELGNYFLTEHKVVKAVRDGARYAARRPYADYPGCSPSTDLVDDTRNVTRTGRIAAAGTPRVWTWTDPTSITVTATCDTTGTYTGIHVSSPIGTPVVTVVATVPYTTLLGQLGLSGTSYNLNARSQAAVTGDMTAPNRLWGTAKGAVGVEFALVLPLLLMFLLGIIDVGRLMWTWNRAEKATQMGVRFAAVTDSTSDGLNAYDFYSGGIARGDPIPELSFGGATCTSAGCTCNSGATCPALGALSTTAFNNTVARMQRFMPDIQSANVVIEYGYSGLGYAGDPYGPDVNPLITVRLLNLTFRPTVGYFFGGSIGLPSFAATLSMEDGTGAISN